MGPQAKLENLSAQVAQLQAALQSSELERARQRAELDVLKAHLPAASEPDQGPQLTEQGIEPGESRTGHNARAQQAEVGAFPSISLRMPSVGARLG